MKSGFFSTKTLANLPANPLDAASILLDELVRLLGSATLKENYEDAVEGLAVVAAYRKFHPSLPIPAIPDIGHNKAANYNGVENFANSARTAVRAAITRRDGAGLFTSKLGEYEMLFGGQPFYEFTDDDFEKIQQLIGELRDLISHSQLVTDDHKRRLLRRLEAMQAELHKRSSDIDRFWGFIGEAGIVVRKFGDDMKPIAERVQSLGRIVIAVIMAKEGIQALPDIAKILIDK